MREHTTIISLTGALCFIAILAFLSGLTGCASMDRFMPFITTLGHGLLGELDILLTEYEENLLPADAAAHDLEAHQAAQALLYAKIDSKLYEASTQVGRKQLAPLRKRLDAVPRASP